MNAKWAVLSDFFADESQSHHQIAMSRAILTKSLCSYTTLRDQCKLNSGSSAEIGFKYLTKSCCACGAFGGSSGKAQKQVYDWRENNCAHAEAILRPLF